MDLKLLQTFITVAELNSFSKAAKKLGYSQPTVSLQIQQLEQELQTSLFDRVGHTIKLTEAGHEKLLMAQVIEHEIHSFTTQSKESHVGNVRIAMADSLCEPLITNHLHTFHKDFPDISLNIMTAGTFDMYSMLNHNQADIVCTLDEHLYDMTYIITNEEKINLHFIASINHPLANKKNITIQDLANEDFLLTEKNMSYRRMLDTVLAKDNIEIHPILEFGNTEDICKLVSQNVGISFLPDFVTKDSIQSKDIVYLDVKGVDLSVWKQILVHKDKWISPVLQETINYLSSISLK